MPLDPDLARLLPVLETQEVVRYADTAMDHARAAHDDSVARLTPPARRAIVRERVRHHGPRTAGPVPVRVYRPDDDRPPPRRAVAPRRRLVHRQPGHRRRHRPRTLLRPPGSGRLGRLPARTRAPVAGGDRRRAGGAGLGHRLTLPNSAETAGPSWSGATAPGGTSPPRSSSRRGTAGMAVAAQLLVYPRWTWTSRAPTAIPRCGLRRGLCAAPGEPVHRRPAVRAGRRWTWPTRASPHSPVTTSRGSRRRSSPSLSTTPSGTTGSGLRRRTPRCVRARRPPRGPRADPRQLRPDRFGSRCPGRARPGAGQPAERLACPPPPSHR